MSLRRVIFAALIGAAALVVLDSPLRFIYLWCLRLTYQTSEFIGLVDDLGPLGGQIMGFNYHRAPAWLHFVGHFLAAAVAYGPFVLAAMLLLRRITGAQRATRCGHCAAILHNLTEPFCPHCRNPL